MIVCYLFIILVGRNLLILRVADLLGNVLDKEMTTIAESTIGPVGILYTGSDDAGVPNVGSAGFGDHVSMIGN